MQCPTRFGAAALCASLAAAPGLPGEQAQSAEDLCAPLATGSAESAVPDGLSAADWTSIRTAHQAAMHAVVAVGDGSLTFAGGISLPTGGLARGLCCGDLDGHGGDLSVLSFAQTALAQPFGAGCAGTGGLVPQITGIGLPTTANAAFGVQLSNGRAFAPALLLFAGEPTAIALGGGCTVLVLLPAASTLRFTNGLGTDAFVFGVPADPAMMGLDLFFQYAIFDPAGAFGPGVAALSNGLRVQVGD